MNLTAKLRGRAVLRATVLVPALVVAAAWVGDSAARQEKKEEKRPADKKVEVKEQKKEEKRDEEERRAAAAERAQALAARRAVAVRAAAVVQRQAWPDEQFERWVFQNDGNAAGARRRFEALLTLQLEEIDRACHLTDAQKQKLHLMGQGDLKRLFDAYEQAKHRFNQMDNDVNRLQEIMQEIRPIQT
ncbi:MAG TPA: hypothetical protein VH120_07055, partial [Gemmataceae bacterium]|nr:hypothetical protein [Gemmataceae bacterium]